LGAKANVSNSGVFLFLFKKRKKKKEKRETMKNKRSSGFRPYLLHWKLK
jgi:hypothetical protein